MSASRITDKLIKTLPTPASGNKITYDSDVRGFGVRITANGSLSFILNFHIHGRERRITIGQYPAWSTSKAREAAKIYRQEIDLGIDPMKERVDEHNAPTMQELFEQYRSKHFPHIAERSHKDQEAMFNKWILPELGKHTKVKDIRSEDVDRLHRKITKSGTPVRANRIIEVLRKTFNLANRWGWIADNPCAGTHRNIEVKRTAYLEESQMKKVLELLDTHPETLSANAIKLLMLTGARRGEMLKAKWPEFDLINGFWTKPSAHTKSKIEHRVRLVSEALDLLKKMKESSPSNQYVFPGKSGKPLTDIKKTWQSICRSAGVENVRIHDQRRTFASLLVASGADFPIISHMLGHTQAQTTMRYTRILNKKQEETTKHFDTAISTIRNTDYDG